jgi:two-component system, sensor histidine kinase and response regulator
MDKPDRKAKILAVDDTPENLDVVKGILQSDYTLLMAVNGSLALKIAKAQKPDLILLDIMMPGMDGYEVCTQLKADETTADIPIVFLTAMTKEEDEAKGLSLGAIDYITKPFSPELVKSRVRNHLQLKLALDALKEQNTILEENATLKEDVERITRHDLKSPLNGIINYPQMIKSEGNLSDQQIDRLDKTVQLGRKMLNMINLSMDLYKMEQGSYALNPETLNLLDVFSEIMDESRIRLKAKRLEIDLMIDDKSAAPEDQFMVEGEKLLLYSMLSNLFKNAVEASPRKEKITIAMKREETHTVNIHNQGSVPKEVRDTFFDKYVTAGKSGGTGLGTYSARLIAETIGGQISLDTSEDEGTTISIIFSKPA